MPKITFPCSGERTMKISQYSTAIALAVRSHPKKREVSPKKSFGPKEQITCCWGCSNVELNDLLSRDTRRPRSRVEPSFMFKFGSRIISTCDNRV